MKVKLLYFGRLRDRFGVERSSIELEDGADVSCLKRVLFADDPAEAASVAAAVNMEYVKGMAALRDGDEVALIPPVAGG